MSKGRKIEVLEKEVTVRSIQQEDYICLTDIGRYKDSERTDDLIRNWVRNRNTIESKEGSNSPKLASMNEINLSF
jgi:hypothetical protein